jgi:tryptophan halogenase
LIAANRAPRTLDDLDFQGAVPYAYHLDADKFAAFLAKDLMQKGVVRKHAHITKVDRDENGFVSKLCVADCSSLTADLYVDCTGQRALLSAGDDWVSYANQLLCDRAVTLRIPQTSADYSPATFTNVKALDAGWAWDISLQNRRGRGYVYSSAHCDPEQAEAVLRRDEGENTDGLNARHIAFKSGRQRSPWSGNVVAIGLAGGFLEPLESTGIYLADYAARVLTEMFPPVPNPEKMQPLATRFNQLMGEMFDELADFLTLHYVVSGRRETPFWRDASDFARQSPRLKDLLEIWNLRPPSFADFSNRYTPFSHQSYEFILLGSGWRPSGADRGTEVLQLYKLLELKKRELLNMLPTCQQFYGLD